MKQDLRLQVKKHVKQLILSGNLENVFSFLRSFLAESKTIKKNEISLYEFQYNALKRKFRQRLIEHSVFSVEQNRISQGIMLWLDENVSEDLKWTNSEFYGGQGIKLSLDDLKKQLLEILELNGTEVIFFFLDKLISGIVKKFEYNRIKEKYQLLEWQSSNHRIQIKQDDGVEYQTIEEILKQEKEKREQIEVKRKRIDANIEKLINSLVETDLINNWKFEYIKFLRSYKFNKHSKPKKTLISSLDIIQIPKFLKNDSDFQIYKRLMIQAQDAYLVGNYQRAYDLCLRVGNEVDPESAQLYEYLFVTYYYLIGPERIISEALVDFQSEVHLKKLFVYASRFVRLQSVASEEMDTKVVRRGANKIAKEVDDIHSLTGEENIKEINSELLLTLADKYSQILDSFREGSVELTADEKKKIIQCILIAKNITEHIRVDAIFATTVINELAGGGKHQWIAIKEDGGLVNTEVGFDAIGHFEDAIRLLAYDKGEQEDKIKEKLADDIFNYLNEKYNFIKYTSGQLEEKEIRTLLTRLMVSFRVATQLFPKSNQFAEIPIAELGSENGILNWYKLDYERELIPITSNEYPHFFEPLKFFQFFLTYRFDSYVPFDWEKEKRQIN